MKEHCELIVFFDGNCVFCSRTAHFLAVHDRRSRLRFARLQGRTASLYDLSKFAEEKDGTLVAWRTANHAIVLRSAAVFAIARALGGPWRMILLLQLLPSTWLDAGYRIMARNRHRLLPPRNLCPTAPAAFLQRMLED